MVTGFTSSRLTPVVYILLNKKLLRADKCRHALILTEHIELVSAYKIGVAGICLVRVRESHGT
jgi:hypothetical protein